MKTLAWLSLFLVLLLAARAISHTATAGGGKTYHNDFCTTLRAEDIQSGTLMYDSMFQPGGYCAK